MGWEGIARAKSLYTRTLREDGRRERDQKSDRIVNRLAELVYDHGLSVEEAAAKLQVSQRSAQTALSRLVGSYKARSNGDFALRLGRCLRKLDELREEAERAWDRSKQPSRTTKQVSKAVPHDGFPPGESGEDIFADAADLVVVEESVEVREQCGDPRFLAEARAAVEDQLKILGAFKGDVHVYAGLITNDQMMQFARAVMRGIEEVWRGDKSMVEKLKQRTLELLPQTDGSFSAPDVQELEPVFQERSI